MATPTTGSLNVIGSSGGMAPFPTSVYADPEEGGSTWATGSGEWSEGRWAFQLMDNATGKVYDSGLMDLQCPSSSVTATAYYRYGRAPVAGCVIYGAGTYYWRVKYQNRDGDWSAWSNSSEFTVAANTRTKVYVDGTSGNDANNGLSAGAAKKTLNGGLALVTGNDYEVILKDDTTIDVDLATNLGSRSGVWIRRSGDGTAKPILLGKQSGQAITIGSDSVIGDFEFQSDNDIGRLMFDFGDATSNIALVNIDNQYIASFGEIPSGRDSEGIVVYGCRMLAQCRRYMLFIGGPRVINVLGCTWDKGSEVEHTVRLTYALPEGANITEFISIDFTILDQSNRGKSSLRCYIKRFFGAYRTGLYRGAVSLGNIDNTGVGFDTTSTEVPAGPTERFYNYSLECCRIYMENSSEAAQNFTCFEGLLDATLASCLFYNTGGECERIGPRSKGDDDPVENVKHLGCSYFTDGVGNQTIEFRPQLSNVNLIDIQYRGCIFSSTPENFDFHYREIIRANSGIPNNDPANPLFLSENVFWEASHLTGAETRIDILDNDLLGIEYKDVATLNAESWAANNIQEALTIDVNTAEPSGSTTNWQTAVSDITGLFESINGEVYDRTASTWAAGAWQPAGSGTGDVAGYPAEDVPVTSFLGLSAGGQFIVLQT